MIAGNLDAGQRTRKGSGSIPVSAVWDRHYQDSPSNQDGRQVRIKPSYNHIKPTESPLMAPLSLWPPISYVACGSCPPAFLLPITTISRKVQNLPFDFGAKLCNSSFFCMSLHVLTCKIDSPGFSEGFMLQPLTMMCRQLCVE